MSDDPRDDDDAVEIPDKLYFRIGELSDLVGVEAHVLRYWEQEFGIRPERSPSKQRMYKKRDIARFLQIKTLLHKQGFTIAGARRALSAARRGEDTPFVPDAEQIQAAVSALHALRDRVGRMKQDVQAAWSPHVEQVRR